MLINNDIRHSSLIEPDFAITNKKAVAAFERVAKKMSTIDNGSESASKALDGWAYSYGVRLDFIRSTNPVDNAVIESFNKRF